MEYQTIIKTAQIISDKLCLPRWIYEDKGLIKALLLADKLSGSKDVFIIIAQRIFNDVSFRMEDMSKRVTLYRMMELAEENKEFGKKFKKAIKVINK